MTKKTSKLLAVFLALLLFFSSCPATALTVEAAAKPKLAKSSASIVIGGTSRIKVKNAPKGAKISYTSGSPKVASVSKKGVVKGIKNGKATLRLRLRAQRSSRQL